MTDGTDSTELEAGRKPDMYGMLLEREYDQEWQP